MQHAEKGWECSPGLWCPLVTRFGLQDCAHVLRVHSHAKPAHHTPKHPIFTEMYEEAHTQRNLGRTCHVTISVLVRIAAGGDYPSKTRPQKFSKICKEIVLPKQTQVNHRALSG